MAQTIHIAYTLHSFFARAGEEEDRRKKNDKINTFAVQFFDFHKGYRGFKCRFTLD